MLRTTAWVTILTLAGLVTGGTTGAWLTERVRGQEIRDQAAQYTARADAISAEAVSALQAIDGATVSPCSEADMALLRSTVLASAHIKNASRLGPDRVVLCDALRSPFDASAPAPAIPDYRTPQHRVQLDVPIPEAPNARAVIIERGNASITLSRGTYANLVDPRFDYVVVARNGEQRLEFLRVGPPLPLTGLPETTGATVDHDGRRYDAVCTRTCCLYATLRHSPPLHTSPLFLGLLFAGGLIGLGLGLILDAWINRLRSPGRRLRKALTVGELDVVYQPIVRIADGERVGAEALLRWRDNRGRPISPDVFVAVAEQDGFVGDLTRFVIQRVLSEVGAALRAHPDFHLSINLPVSDLLDSGFTRFLARELQRHGVAASSLGFEITERSTAAHGAINEGIQHLRQLGHTVSIDDFGADYSSLSYLSQLQVDCIKLDRSFIACLGDDNSASIVPQIVQMSQVLNVALVVEGVERHDQADYLVNLDPTILGQGWLFSRPLPASRLFA